jgi:ATP adenylyltransferase/5',5'''-P-1,P-4-tetraphosphate phosphorylase II
MINEHDLIVLTTDIQDQDGDLKAGDVGTVVHVHPGHEALVVEFTTLHGGTVAIATLLSSQVRPVTDEDIIHARKLAVAV